MPVEPVAIPLAVTYLYYTDADHVIRRLVLEQDELVALARDRVQRNFTTEECDRFRIAHCE